MRVAAWQAPLLAPGSMAAIDLIRQQIARCETEGIEILCCPEAILGGLADDCDRPGALALSVDAGDLQDVLSPLASEMVTTIVGFTERDSSGRLFNAAAVFQRGSVAGLYRKHHPAIRRSVYAPGDRLAVFTMDGLTFGIVICRDSAFAEPARSLVGLGASVLFVPSNTALPPAKTGPEIVDEARKSDIARALENRVTVIRADVAGRTVDRIAYGTSAAVGANGDVLVSAPMLMPTLLVVSIPSAASARGSRTPPRPAVPRAG